MADPVKAEPNQALNYYARVLRVIGQDLLQLFPTQIQIEQQGRNFIARVRCDRKRSEAMAPPAAKPGFGGVIHKLASYRLDKGPEKHEQANITRNYTPADISRIDESGLQRRVQVGKIPDFHSLGEALRTIGRIIDGEGGQLTRLIKDQRRFFFDYVTRSGEIRKIEMTLSELYKVQQSYYKTRSGHQNLDLWQGKK